MSGAARLDSCPVDIGLLRESSRECFLQLLDTVTGRKALAVDSSLLTPLGLVVEVASIREHGVEKIFGISPPRLDTDCTQIIYVLRQDVALVRTVIQHIRQHVQDDQRKSYLLVFVPRRSVVCERILEEEGVFGYISITEFDLGLIPLDPDLVSLEIDLFRECYLESDASQLESVARSLATLHAYFGPFKSVHAKGTLSKAVLDLFQKNALPSSPPASGGATPAPPQIGGVILIDRDVDMVTPMCTPLTYEGLIGEFFGIQTSHVQLDAELVPGAAKPAAAAEAAAAPPPPPPKVKTILNSNDELYRDIRDRNFTSVPPLLNAKAHDINAVLQERHQAQSISEIKEFVAKIGPLQNDRKSLELHTNVAAKINTFCTSEAFHQRLEAEQSLLAGSDSKNDYIEDCLIKKISFVKTLRLVALRSLVKNGLKPKFYQSFARELLQSHGYEHLVTLHALERVGLWKQKRSKNRFSMLRKQLNLINAGCDDVNPADIAYVFSGYAPLSVRLVQAAFQPGWRRLDELLSALPGPTVLPPSERSPSSSSERSSERSPPLQQSALQSAAAQGLATLVYFVGGVTSAELAALRFVCKQKGKGFHFLVATTKVVTGDELISSLIEKNAD